MSDEHDDIGAEGGHNDNAESLPPAPSEDDDSSLGDSDQLSDAPPSGHERMRDPEDGSAA